MGDASYCESKAIELIFEAKLIVTQGSIADYHQKISQAVSLLALSRAIRDGSVPAATQP